MIKFTVKTGNEKNSQQRPKVKKIHQESVLYCIGTDMVGQKMYAVHYLN